MKNILVTGSSGFIGSALTLELINQGYFVIGIDNHNTFYDVSLKENRLKRHIQNKQFKNYILDIKNTAEIGEVFRENSIDIVINLAAQAGVEHSTKKPFDYIDSNIIGFMNILECCKNFNIKHLIYASSSSVYGLNGNTPYSEYNSTDHPVSLYAATKKCNELLAHYYSHMFNLPCTGLRFFTVYGPWDRPDMALQKFTKKILNDEVIQLFNFGKHVRDFTYIDDITKGISKVIDRPPKNSKDWDKYNPQLSSSSAPFEVYNIGNSQPVELESYVSLLEKELGIIAKKEFKPMKPYDMEITISDSSKIRRDLNFIPRTNVEEGIQEFVKWYLDYYD